MNRLEMKEQNGTTQPKKMRCVLSIEALCMESAKQSKNINSCVQKNEKKKHMSGTIWLFDALFSYCLSCHFKFYGLDSYVQFHYLKSQKIFENDVRVQKTCNRQNKFSIFLQKL